MVYWSRVVEPVPETCDLLVFKGVHVSSLGDSTNSVSCHMIYSLATLLGLVVYTNCVLAVLENLSEVFFTIGYVLHIQRQTSEYVGYQSSELHFVGWNAFTNLISDLCWRVRL